MGHKGRKKWKTIPRTFLTATGGGWWAGRRDADTAPVRPVRLVGAAAFQERAGPHVMASHGPRQDTGVKACTQLLATPQTPSNTGAELPPSEGLAIRAWLLPADAYARTGTQPSTHQQHSPAGPWVPPSPLWPLLSPHAWLVSTLHREPRVVLTTGQLSTLHRIRGK